MYTDQLPPTPQITPTDSFQKTPEENRYAELICKYVDLIQKKFEEKRLCSTEPNNEYASLANQKKISVYWHTTNKKITVSFAPKEGIKPKWITEIHLGDELKISAENDFFIFRRPIIDITITSQHSEETEILRTLKGAYDIALSHIKANNLISPPKNLPLPREPEKKVEEHKTDSDQTESLSPTGEPAKQHETSNEKTGTSRSSIEVYKVALSHIKTPNRVNLNAEKSTENISPTDQTTETQETDTDHADSPLWQQCAKHFWNVFKTTSCFKSCCGHEKED